MRLSSGGTWAPGPDRVRPPTAMRPASSRSNPATMRSSVLFPQPEGPSRARNSPAATSMVTPSTAGAGVPA